MITAIANAIAAVFRFLTGRHDAKNASDVKTAAVAQRQVDERNRIEGAVANCDTESVRKDIAE